MHDLAKELEEEEKVKQREKRKEFQEQLDKDLKDPFCDISWKYGMWPRPMRLDPDIPEEDPNPNLPVRIK